MVTRECSSQEDPSGGAGAWRSAESRSQDQACSFGAGQGGVRMRCMPDWKSCELLIDSINRNLELIWSNKFMTLAEYRRSVESGALARSKLHHDDRSFQKAHPDHPLAGDNRYARIKAADAIKEAAKQINRPLPADILAQIHKALFDCSAAVRNSLAQALFFVGGPESVPVLERLLNTDSESKMVTSSAKVTLARCKMRASLLGGTDPKVVMVVSPDLELISELLEISSKHSFRLFVPDPPFNELVTVRSAAHVIDRWYMGKEVWESYCGYLDNVAVGRSQHGPTAASQMALLPDSVLDDTPLVITDWRMDRSMSEFRSPNKPKESVFFVSGGSTDMVTLIVQKAVTGIKPIDFHEVVQEVNAKRLAQR